MNKIGLCFMNIGEKYKQITYWSRQNKISYCNLHGYDFIEDESVYNPDKPIPWTKIPLILKYIDSYDYIIWVDADILIMNTNIKVEDFIKTYPCDIICGSDWKMINTGVMIIKCNDFTKEFIKSIETNIYDPNEDKSGRYLNWEQGSFINLYDKNFMNCKEHIHITCPTELNSYWFNYFPGHFVLHFAGVRGQLLQYLIRDYYPGRFNYEDDNSYNSRMEWLAGPVREHLDKKLHHEKELEIKNMYSFRILLDELKVYHYDISNKIRIGNNYDGGYVIPNNITFSKLYSFGISNNMTFDVDFVNKFDIPALLFDPTISKLPNDEYNYDKITFNKIGLYSSDCTKMIGDIVCDVKKLDTLLENEDNNIILKIDIEGDEFSSLLSTSENILKKCACIVVEFHWLTNDNNLKLHTDCFKKLNKLFYPIHIHINNHSPVIIKDDFYHVPDVIEMTYVRKDFIEDKDLKLSSYKFPTVLDNPNHGLYPDIPLNFYPFQPYYFSLTTIPSRIGKLNLVIDSLCNQIIKPEKIFINIPKFYNRFSISYEDLKIPSFPDNVIINICDEDYGAATKFLPIMKMTNIDDDTPIIIVDDDIIYDLNLSANLLKDSVRYPDSCITSFGITHSSYLFHNSNWIIDYNSCNKTPCGFRCEREGFIDVFEAFYGTLLKKKLFKEDVFDVFSNEFYFSDDVWFSGHIIKNGFSIFLSKYDIKSKNLQNEVDALSSNVSLRNERMNLVATYFHEKYNIW